MADARCDRADQRSRRRYAILAVPVASERLSDDDHNDDVCESVLCGRDVVAIVRADVERGQLGHDVGVRHRPVDHAIVDHHRGGARCATGAGASCDVHNP